jgi:hypothetical protein
MDNEEFIDDENFIIQNCGNINNTHVLFSVKEACDYGLNEAIVLSIMRENQEFNEDKLCELVKKCGLKEKVFWKALKSLDCKGVITLKKNHSD